MQATGASFFRRSLDALGVDSGVAQARPEVSFSVNLHYYLLRSP